MIFSVDLNTDWQLESINAACNTTIKQVQLSKTNGFGYRDYMDFKG